MFRILLASILAGMVGFTGWNATAKVYRCRNTDGVLVFTDDPANLPSGCKPTEPEASQTGLSIVHPTPAPTGPSDARDLLEEKTLRAEERSDQARRWKEEAEFLVKDYRQNLALRYQSMQVRERRKVFQRIGEIKKRRDVLLKEIAEARLPSKEQSAIENTLAVIPP